MLASVLILDLNSQKVPMLVALIKPSQGMSP